DKDYDSLIDSKGGLDLLVLGLGINGHLGFNEPGSEMDSKTRLVDLDNSTINVNAAKYFDGDCDEIPKKALTMGLETIMKSRKIILMIFGESKIIPTKILLSSNKFNQNFPASILMAHKDLTIVIDEEVKNGL
ncbi:MAG: glucosamine-6-phosphate deaminase, partial [Mycoplasma sp.]